MNDAERQREARKRRRLASLYTCCRCQIAKPWSSFTTNNRKCDECLRKTLTADQQLAVRFCSLPVSNNFRSHGT